MSAIGNEVTWKNREYRCIASKAIETPKGAALKFEWAAQCDCGAKFSFEAFPWQFPFSPARSISQFKKVKPVCDACSAKGEYNADPLVDQLYESLMLACLTTIERHYPISTHGIVSFLAGLSDKHYDGIFTDDEFEAGKTLRAVLIKAAKRGGRGVINKVLTRGRREGKWLYRHNRWYPIEAQKVTIIRRDAETLDAAVNIVRFVLSIYPSSTAPEIHKRLVELYRQNNLTKEVTAKFAIGGSQRAIAAALIRILTHMKEGGIIVNDKAGRGARWTLAE